jgi:hypothetical protein
MQIHAQAERVAKAVCHAVGLPESGSSVDRISPIIAEALQSAEEKATEEALDVWVMGDKVKKMLIEAEERGRRQEREAKRSHDG